MIETQKSLQNYEEIKLSVEKPESTSFASRNNLCRRLNRGRDARAQFVESHINKGLAYQLRALREARSWSQEQFAVEVNMPQTAISRLESSKYGKPTITTLKRIAKVHDVALEVRFVPFSKLLNRITRTPYIETGLSSDSIDVPSYGEEVRKGLFETRLPLSIVNVPKKPSESERKTVVKGVNLAQQGEQQKEDSQSIRDAQESQKGQLEAKNAYRMAAGR